MNKHLSFYIKPVLVIAGCFYACCCLISGTLYSAKLFFKSLVIIEPALVLLLFLYRNWIWKICPWETVPRLKKYYKGIIHYVVNDERKEKSAEVYISQCLDSVSVKLVTDEITSASITYSFVEENNCWILYYVYITNPQAKYSKDNPIKRGVVRLELEKPELGFFGKIFKSYTPVKTLDGTYWTSGEAIGDLHFETEN